MVEMDLQNSHFVPADRAFQRVVAERGQDSSSPMVKAPIKTVFTFRNGTMKFSIDLSVSGV